MLPTVVSPLPVEPYEPYTAPVDCDPTPRPGVTMFRDYVLATLGGRDVGIPPGGGCRPGSHHNEGRAWDWGMDAANSDEAARVDELLAWLEKPGPGGEPDANLRRAGIILLIWNRMSWSTHYRAWRPYTGAVPHTDHVHVSFGWPGALGTTSLYPWLEAGGVPRPPDAPPVFPPLYVPPGTSRAVPVLLGAVLGYAGYRGVRALLRA
jgi:hypothetical protein